MSKRELFAERTHSLLVCMEMDEMQNPILVPTIDSVKKNGERNGTSGGEYSLDSLAEVFGCEYGAFREDLAMEIECFEEKTSQEINRVVNELLKTYKIKENLDGVRDAVLVI